MPDTLVGTPDPDEPWPQWENERHKGMIIQFDGTLTEANIADLRAYADAIRHLPPGQVRQFASGATRDTDEGKLDFEAYLSPLVLLRYAQYMQKHQTRSDGTQRAGDDWQAGMPKDAYMKSMLRHVMDVWLIHRDVDMAREDLETALCAVIFNAMGYLFNELEGLDP